MYLVDSSAPAINNRKWNLGRMRGLGCGNCPSRGMACASCPRNGGMGRMGLSPVRLPNLGASSTAQNWRRLSGRMRGLGRLGDAGTGPYCVYYGADGVTPESIDYSSDVVECAGNGGSWNGGTILNTPSPVGTQNPSPVAGGASNGGITTVMATTPSKDPLDYVSPQAAVAAGLDPTNVYAAWSKALSRFPSPQAAQAAGIPAGVVNQLWQQSNVNATNAAAASATNSSRIGTIALYGGGALLLAMLLGGGRRR